MISIQDLHIEYDDQLVFDHVNLTVQADQLVAIETEVLDGGTSFLRGVGGFLNGVGGRVEFEGFNLLEPTPKWLNFMIGYVYETHGLVSLFSVYQNIILPLQFHTDLGESEIGTRLNEVCNLLHIDRSLYERRPHQLNDVQTRLVNLARALIPRPRLLLVDELEGGMSEDVLQDTMTKLRERQRDHPMAIIMTTSSDIIMDHADRVYRIENYNLVQER